MEGTAHGLGDRTDGVGLASGLSHDLSELHEAYDRLGLHGDLIPGAILHAGAML